MRSDRMLVGIIGGHGAMGRFFEDVFERAGHSVICSGRDSALSNRELAGQSDVVVVSVPIHSTVEVIHDIAPVMREDQLLCDLTSLKAEPVKAMLESCADVIGMHPMFGPGVESLEGQKIVVTPARCGDDLLDSFLGIFRNEGAEITISTPEEHDRMMAVVQGLTHFATLSVAETMRIMGVGPDDVLSFMSPVYRMEMGIIGRILGHDPALYGDILQMNPAVPEMTGAFEQAARNLRGIVDGGDIHEFETFFRRNAEKFSSYMPQATDETDRMIKALVK